ncbi:MAG: type 1 glutamine amidotransferase [Candidatus Nomurabacteria bacterium]|nr:type 1 glutamine amidotransferase [Candidatus Nomurabacteria bacterium]USN87412.1 MAG: type 1 glutamine amidotransferase [Candidatus Nomurabacteria bacterium]
MKKILSIQFRKNQASIEQEQTCIRREIKGNTDVDFIDALDKTIDWNFPEVIMSGYDGVILGGSGEFDFDGNRCEDDEKRRISYELLGQLRPLFQYIFDNDIPTLGICYGHQLLGAFAGAQVCYSEQQKKTCTHQVKLLVDKNEYFLFTDLPDTFDAHYAHKDILDRIPDNAVLLMSGGDKCEVSALRYKKNIYTVQFHPELTYGDMMGRIKESPGYLPDGAAVEEIFKDDIQSNKILFNFSKMVANRVKSDEFKHVGTTQ